MVGLLPHDVVVVGGPDDDHGDVLVVGGGGAAVVARGGHHEDPRLVGLLDRQEHLAVLHQRHTRQARRTADALVVVLAVVGLDLREGQVDDLHLLLDGVADTGGDDVGGAASLGVQHADRHHHGLGGDTGHAAAVAGDGGDHAGDDGPVPLGVVGRGVGFDQVDALDQPSGEVGVVQVDPGVEDRDDGALPAAHVPRVERPDDGQVGLLGHERVVRRGRRDQQQRRQHRDRGEGSGAAVTTIHRGVQRRRFATRSPRSLPRSGHAVTTIASRCTIGAVNASPCSSVSCSVERPRIAVTSAAS